MSREKDKELQAVLQALGFTPENHQTWTLWRLPAAALAPARPALASPAATSKRHPSQLPTPWRISHCELAERRNGLTLHGLRIVLDQAAVLANLDALTKKYFGARTTADFVYTPDGSIWCLFEFINPNHKEKDVEAPRPGEAPRPLAALTAQGRGFAGFKCRLVAEAAAAQLVVFELFGVGFVPHAFASMPLRFWADALGLRTLGQRTGQEFEQASLYELSFPLIAPVLTHLGENGVKPEALLSLQTLLAKGRATYSPTVLAGEVGFVINLPGGGEGSEAGMSEVVLTPLEVLEAREKADICRPLDRLLSAGKMSEALSLARREFAAHNNPLFMMRRLALLTLIGSGGDEPKFMAQALQREPEHKLFLSTAATLAIKAEDRALVLTYLSQLGGLLMDDVRSAEHLSTFELVLPELLGDGWSVESPDKASDCYHRVLEKRGDMPRLLRKLIYLARQTGKAAAESAYLHRLAAVERRRGELARLHFRLAELRAQTAGGTEEAIQLAQKALKLDLTMYEAALLAAQLQIDKGRFEEAIKGLDALLKDKNLSLTARGRHDLEATVAHVWNHNLGRPDLAERRYEAAISYDRYDLYSLRELERIYRHFARTADLARILELQFDYFEKHEQSAPLKPLFDELVAMLRGPLEQPKRALEFYQRLLAASTIEAQDLDLVLGWNDLTIDWPAIYTKLLAKLAAVPAGKRRADVLCRLAEICRDKLGDDAGAVRHLHAANREGWIDASGFAFLIERLAKVQDYKSLVQIYQRRIKQVPAAEQQQLLLELLSLPGELTDVQRDLLAVQVLSLDQEADTPVKQRFQIYQSAGDVKGISRLLATLLEQRRLTTFEQLKWMDYAVQCLAGCSSKARFAHMDAMYRQQLALSEDPVGLLHKALANLQEGGDRDMLTFYVQALLKHGLLPALSERMVEALLDKQDQDLALYHELLSIKAQIASVAATHARIAAALYGKRPFQEGKTEAMLARLCVLVACAEDDLAELRSLVSRSGHWLLLAKALQKQADLEDERRRKFKLLEQLGVVYWNELRDIPKARQAFGAALPLAPEPHKIKLMLATLAGEMDDRADEIKLHLDFLLDPASTLDVPAMTRSVGRLLKLREDASTIQRLIQPHVEQAYNRGLWEMAGRLAGVLLDNALVSSELHKIAMKAATVSRQSDQVINHWWRGLACVANKSKLRAYLSETSAIIEKADYKHLMLACYQAAFEHQIGDRIGPKIKHELTLQYAALLFDQESTRANAMTVYAEACAAEPDDYRTWMPLYFLLIEYGTPSERLDHLRAILPKLKVDPRPLKSFPLTIESLQVEVNELEKQLKQDIKQARGGGKPAREAVPAKPPLGAAAYLPGGAPAHSSAPVSLQPAKSSAGPMKLPDVMAAHVSKPPKSLPPVEPLPLVAPFRGHTGAPLASPLPMPKVAASEELDERLDISSPGRGAWLSDTAAFAQPPTAAPGPEYTTYEPLPATPPPAPVANKAAAVLPLRRPVPELQPQKGPEDEAMSAALFQDLGFSVQQVGGESTGFGLGKSAEAVALSPVALAQPLSTGSFLQPSTAAPLPPPTLVPSPQAQPAAAVAAIENSTEAEEAPAAAVAERKAAAVALAVAEEAVKPSPTQFTLDLAAPADPSAPAPVLLAFALSGPLPVDSSLAGAAAAAPPDRPDAPAFELGLDSLQLDGPLYTPSPLADETNSAQPAPALAVAQSLAGEEFSLGGSFSLDLPAALPVAEPPGRLDTFTLDPEANQSPADKPAAARTPPHLYEALDLAIPDMNLELDYGLGLADLAGPMPSEASPPASEAASAEASHGGSSYDEAQLSDDELSLYEDGQSPPPRLAKVPQQDGPMSDSRAHHEQPSTRGERGQDASTASERAGSGLSPGDERTTALQPNSAGMGYTDLAIRPEDDRSGDSMSMAPRSPVFAVNVGTEGAESDWRLAVIKGDFNADLTSRLLQQAFASELEKHLAIQCVALVGGNCDRLSNWHWRVWRKPDEFGYPLSGKDRFPAQVSPPILHSTLHKFIIMATPLLVKVFRDRFSLNHLQRRLNLSTAHLNKLRKPLAWDKGVLKDVGLHLFAERLADQNFQLFSLNGLGGDLFYDGLRRSIYLDEVYFRKVPPSHLFHRLLGLVWAIRVHYFVPLALHPRKDILPFLGRLHAHMNRQGFSKLKSQLSGGNDFDKELQGADLRALRDVHEKLGMPTDEQVLQLWEAMQTHLYRMLLAETLDVIGLFESLLSDDLLRVNGLKHSEIYQRSPYSKSLIEFVTKLKV